MEGWRKPGLEEFLANCLLGTLLLRDTCHRGGTPIGKAPGVVGPYGEIPKRYLVPIAGYTEPTKKTIYRPYYVAGTDVAVMGRNNPTSMQVWSLRPQQPRPTSDRNKSPRSPPPSREFGFTNRC